MRATLAAVLLAGCAAPVIQAPPHVPPYAARPFEPFSRANAVAIAEREWRGFGSVIDDDPPAATPHALRPDQQPGLWQRVADYWWQGQDDGNDAQGWSSRYDAAGAPYPGDAPAWSAAFVSYVMRMAGAAERFPYSPLHADYINAAARRQGALTAERPEAYAPRPGDLICMGRGDARALTFDDLPAARFLGHCDLVTDAGPGQVRVIGGNVFGGVTLKHVPTTPDGRLAAADGSVLDSRFPWFVVLRVGYVD